ncbi:MAG: hypothetical protein M3135_02310, partial [Actinomycetota bacterium]|nr:hypothetical protein [Actinomycetota bacterium]
APVLAALKGVVDRLDPDRVWLPSSPSGPRFHNRLDVIAADPDGLHDVHGPWEHQGIRAHHELYDRGTSLFNSEFGVEGMTNRRTHEALIREGRRWPATRANPIYRHLGDWWNNEPLVQASFGGRIGDIERLRRASQLLQAEGLRYAVEANRRRAFRNSGSIPWQFNESYPNAWCTSAVDHRGDPKPAYHAVRQAYRRVVICAAFDGMSWSGRDRFEASVWAWADDGIGDVTAVARLLDTGGTRLAEAAWPVDLVPGPALRIGEIAHPVPDESAFILDLQIVDRADRVIASNRYPFTATGDLGPLLELAPATVDARLKIVGDEWSVELEQMSGPVAFGLTLEDDRPIDTQGWAVVSDGGFHLLPHERRTIGVSWDEAPVEGRRLRLSGWNVDGATLGVAM